MYKLMSNDLVVDIIRSVCFVRYLSKSKRWIITDSQSAHGVMSSDGKTIYHIAGRSHACPDKLISVQLVKIDSEEYNTLATQIATRIRETEELRSEIASLKEQLNGQNDLLQMILAKL